MGKSLEFTFILLIFYLYMVQKMNDTIIIHTKSKTSVMLFEIFKDKNIMLYLLSIVVPTGIIAVFITYTLPLDIADYGYSTMVVSFILLIKSFVVAYAAPYTTKYINKKFKGFRANMLYLIGVIITLIFYANVKGIWISALTAIILGLLDSFGIGTIFTYFDLVKEPNTYSDEDSSVACNVALSAGRIAGPLIISFSKTIMSLPIITSIGMLIYLITNKLNSIKKDSK